jgi:hypothetical protein
MMYACSYVLSQPGPGLLQVAEFVLDTYCSTPLQPARADMSEGALKGAALKALARALVPDSDQVQPPPAYLDAVARLQAALLPLLEPDEETGILQVGCC